MFLSKLVLDPTHTQARRDLANAYEMHRTLSRVYADSPENAPARFLWRLEEGSDRRPGEGAIVLLQSATPGRWESLAELPGYAHAVFPDKAVKLAELMEIKSKKKKDQKLFVSIQNKLQILQAIQSG